MLVDSLKAAKCDDCNSSEQKSGQQKHSESRSIGKSCDSSIGKANDQDFVSTEVRFSRYQERETYEREVHENFTNR